VQCLRDSEVWLQFSLTQCYCAVTYNSDYCTIVEILPLCSHTSSCSKCFQTVFHNMCTCFTVGISLLLPCTFKHFLHFQCCTDQCCTLSALSRQNCWKGSSYVPSMISDKEEGICVLCRFGTITYNGIIPLSETVAYMKHVLSKEFHSMH
jgi:hypothetical protein